MREQDRHRQAAERQPADAQKLAAADAVTEREARALQMQHGRACLCSIARARGWWVKKREAHVYRYTYPEKKIAATPAAVASAQRTLRFRMASEKVAMVTPA